MPRCSPGQKEILQVRPYTHRADARNSLTEIILRLPPPPSTNNLFLTRGRRRIRTTRYRDWQARAGSELLEQRLGCIGGPWDAHIVLPGKLRGDVDNYSRPFSICSSSTVWSTTTSIAVA